MAAFSPQWFQNVTSRAGEWVPLPYMDSKSPELPFRHKVISFLKAEELLSEERIELLLSWQKTGFSVHSSVTVGSEDAEGTERLARYLLRPALSLERMSWDGDESVLYRRKARGRFAGSQTTFDAMDFLARLLMHIPQPTWPVSESPLFATHTKRLFHASEPSEKVQTKGTFLLSYIGDLNCGATPYWCSA